MTLQYQDATVHARILAGRTEAIRLYVLDGFVHQPRHLAGMRSQDAQDILRGSPVETRNSVQSIGIEDSRNLTVRQRSSSQVDHLGLAAQAWTDGEQRRALRSLEQRVVALGQ